jgi:hypothetical protein
VNREIATREAAKLPTRNDDGTERTGEVRMKTEEELFFDEGAPDDEPSSDAFDDTVYFCPECETPNQFGELCPRCQAEIERES